MQNAPTQKDGNLICKRRANISEDQRIQGLEAELMGELAERLCKNNTDTRPPGDWGSRKATLSYIVNWILKLVGVIFPNFF